MFGIVAAVHRHGRAIGRVAMCCTLHFVTAVNAVLISRRMRVADGTAVLFGPKPVLVKGIDV